MLHPQVSIGYEIGIIIWWIFLGMAALGILLGILGLVGLARDSDWSAVSAAFGGIFLAVALIGGGITTFAVWPPLKMQYHEYRPVSGIVQNTSSRFLGDGNGGVNQRIAITIRGQIYGCDDTRCSSLKVGEAVTLLCVEEFQTNATPGYVCNWGKLGLNG